MHQRVDYRPLVVIKLGSSVLNDAGQIREAAREICRLSLTRRVLAVVSALPGRTDELMRMAGGVTAAPHPDLVARLLATGEEAAVALVAMAARGAGGRVHAVTSGELNIRTTGPLLDADPVELDPSSLLGALERAALVVPGFVGRDTSESVSLLGRGGSDLTALFLAISLKAEECRLIKDVDGLYTDDPRVVPGADRYATATWRRALAVGGQVVQPKAVQYAEHHDTEFVLCALGGDGGTRVGRGPDALIPAQSTLLNPCLAEYSA